MEVYPILTHDPNSGSGRNMSCLNSRIHHRRSIRLKEYDYSTPNAYFVTICAFQKQYLFGEIENGEMKLNNDSRIVQEQWNELPQKFPGIKLDEFVIMPNHVHGIVWITDKNDSIPVGAIHELPLRRRMIIPMVIGYFKMNTAKSINTLRQLPGIAVWQRNYYEHVIRNEHDLIRIREYIQNNPLKWTIDPENN